MSPVPRPALYAKGQGPGASALLPSAPRVLPCAQRSRPQRRLVLLPAPRTQKTNQEKITENAAPIQQSKRETESKSKAPRAQGREGFLFHIFAVQILQQSITMPNPKRGVKGMKKKQRTERREGASNRIKRREGGAGRSENFGAQPATYTLSPRLNTKTKMPL